MTRAAGKQERALSLKVADLEGRAELLRQMAPHTVTPPCTVRLRPLLPKTLVAAGAEEQTAAEGGTKLLSELSSAEINQVIRATLPLDMAEALRCQGQDRLRVLAQGRTLTPTPTPAATLTLAPALTLAPDLTLTPTLNPQPSTPNPLPPA